MGCGKLTKKIKRRKAAAAEHGPIGLDIGTANIVVYSPYSGKKLN